jgi:hypothetical protein
LRVEWGILPKVLKTKLGKINFKVFDLRSIIKSLIAFGFGVIFTVVLVYGVLYYHFGAERNAEGASLGSPFGGISLLAPPAYAVEATETTPPLNTSRIGLIA